MNAENFAQFLSANAQLYHLSYVELENLAMEFPYAQNLHLLLFAKSWLEQHPQAEVNLRNAAIYSTDRRKLYTFVQELGGQLITPGAQFNMLEDYLELAQLSRLPELQELPVMETGSLPLFDVPEQIIPPAETAQIHPKRKAAPPPPLSQEEIREQLSQLFQLDGPGQNTLPRPEAPEKPLKTPTSGTDNAFAENLRKKLACRLEEHPGAHPGATTATGTPPPNGIPLPKSAFSSWKNNFSITYLQERLDALKKALSLPDETLHADPVDAIARDSVRENQFLASETLAELLLRQGQYEKALQVYERLILIFPEKTAFFAAKIENIKNNKT
jgi:tetratricopeptide (TPR) repeat protein